MDEEPEEKMEFYTLPAERKELPTTQIDAREVVSGYSSQWRIEVTVDNEVVSAAIVEYAEDVKAKAEELISDFNDLNLRWHPAS